MAQICCLQQNSNQQLEVKSPIQVQVKGQGNVRGIVQGAADRQADGAALTKQWCHGRSWQATPLGQARQHTSAAAGPQGCF